MRLFKYRFYGIVLSLFVLQILCQDCSINIKELNTANDPLFLTFEGEKIIFPKSKTSEIIFKPHEKFKLDCPYVDKSDNNIRIKEKTLHKRTVDAECGTTGKIKIDNSEISIKDVVCTNEIKALARKTSKNCGNTNYKEIEVGFMLPAQFLKLYTTCFDDDKKNVIYTVFELTKEIDQQPRQSKRPSIFENNFYVPKMKEIFYAKTAELKTINGQLGLNKRDHKFINPEKGEYYFATGHLIANSDFFYVAQQYATFFYINTTPQWQKFNNGNWKKLEARIRKYAVHEYVDLTVYTGTYGILTLPNHTDEETELYLAKEKGKKVVPIPEQMWKVVYDPENKAGVAILGINNPYVKDDDIKHKLICTDISQKISFFDFEYTKKESGYLYACTVDDLRLRGIPYIPNLDITKLLGEGPRHPKRTYQRTNQANYRIKQTKLPTISLL